MALIVVLANMPRHGHAISLAGEGQSEFIDDIQAVGSAVCSHGGCRKRVAAYKLRAQRRVDFAQSSGARRGRNWRGNPDWLAHMRDEVRWRFKQK